MVNRNEIRRLMGEETFDILEPHMPQELLEAYALVCDVLFTGDAKDEVVGGKSRKLSHSGWFYKDTRFIAVKKTADWFLAQTAAAVRRWAVASPRRGAKGLGQVGNVADPRTRSTRRRTAQP